VEYLVHVVSKEGIQTSKRKIEAILKVKTPTNQTELKSFLGMANHYGKFVPRLADLSSPLNNLLKKLRETLTSAEVLAHYTDVPLGLACDASGVGIGAVIYHKYENGTERPIVYASKSLSDAEQKYSQIDRSTQYHFWGQKVSSVLVWKDFFTP